MSGPGAVQLFIEQGVLDPLTTGIMVMPLRAHFAHVFRVLPRAGGQRCEPLFGSLQCLRSLIATFSMGDIAPTRQHSYSSRIPLVSLLRIMLYFTQI